MASPPPTGDDGLTGALLVDITPNAAAVVAPLSASPTSAAAAAAATAGMDLSVDLPSPLGGGLPSPGMLLAAGGGAGFAPMESGGPYPRVAHRHLYLWVERKANERGPEAARRLKTIPSLEAFYAEVAVANAGNKHYSPLKLQEMVVRAPPYSLLYNRTLNMSTNVLKRWNRTNGMINWFLWRAGCGPPSAAEVIQLSRVHVARALMRRPDYTRVFGPAAAALAAAIKSEAAAGNGEAGSVASSSSSVTGGGAGQKRRRGGKKAAAAAAAALVKEEGEEAAGGGGVAGAEDVIASLGPILLFPAAAPLGVTTPEALLAWLTRRHPSSPIALPAVRAAVEAGAWALAPAPSALGEAMGHDGGNGALASYAPNVAALDVWSADGGLWQEFARLCLERGVKFDQCLFDFPDLPTASSSSGGGGGAAAAAAAVKPEGNGVEVWEVGNGHGVSAHEEEGQQQAQEDESKPPPLLVLPPPSHAASAAGKEKGGGRKRGRCSTTAVSTTGASRAASSSALAPSPTSSAAAATAEARAAKRRRSIAHLIGPEDRLLEEGGVGVDPGTQGIVLGQGPGGQLPQVVADLARRLVARVEAAGQLLGSRGPVRLLGGRLHAWQEGEEEAAGFWHGKALWAPKGDPCVRILFPHFLPTGLGDAAADGAVSLEEWATTGAAHQQEPEVSGSSGSSAVDSLAAGARRFVLDAPPRGEGRAQQVAVLVFGGGAGGNTSKVLVVAAYLLSAEPAGTGQARFMAKYFFAEAGAVQQALPGLGLAPVVLGGEDGGSGEGEAGAHPDDRASARLWRMHAAATAKAAAQAAAQAATAAAKTARGANNHGGGNGGNGKSASRQARPPSPPPAPASLSALLQATMAGSE